RAGARAHPAGRAGDEDAAARDVLDPVVEDLHAVEATQRGRSGGVHLDPATSTEFLVQVAGDVVHPHVVHRDVADDGSVRQQVHAPAARGTRARVGDLEVTEHDV